MFELLLFFRFLSKSERIFSTPPLHNDHQELALGFYHMQNVSISNLIMHRSIITNISVYCVCMVHACQKSIPIEILFFLVLKCWYSFRIY